MATYQHVLPGMQAEAAATFEQLIPRNPKVIGAAKALVETVEETVKTRKKTTAKQ
jgi:hypothetical protein